MRGGLRRTLTHYWRMALAVVAGTAVGTAVLVGALLVGDSVETSLRRLSLALAREMPSPAVF